MSVRTRIFEEQLAELLLRVEKLEGAQANERDVPQWRYLAERQHAWRRQLCVKGRNMTAAQLVDLMNVNRLTVEETSVDFDLPLEAVLEAVCYCRDNAELLMLEANEQRRRLVEKGHSLGPAALSG